MKQLLILLFFFFLFVSGHGQSKYKFKADTNYRTVGAGLLNKIDSSFTAKYDFQLRFWFNNGMNRVNTTYLLIMTTKDKLWFANLFTFTTRSPKRDNVEVRRKILDKVNYDSFFNRLVKDSLFLINSFTKKDEDQLYKKYNKNFFIETEGPYEYRIELLTPKKQKGLLFYHPWFYYEEYKDKTLVLEKPVKILNALLSLFN